jgi:DNA-binding transcriptional regulator YhcF (GntR family)
VARVYAGLRVRILAGEFAPGTRLPSHTALAAEFGVAPFTARQALGHLQEAGLVSCEQGRGTFVRQSVASAVLIVDADPLVRGLLRDRVAQSGYRAIEASSAAEGLVALESDGTIALVLSEVRLEPADVVGFTNAVGAAAQGPPRSIDFLRAVRRRRPAVPLVALTDSAHDLAALHGAAECPVLILPKPIRPSQVEEVFLLTLRPAPPGALRRRG